ncbi:MAG: hypothetical protein HZC01_05610 [Candidatus Kerfeldbacteria bacterium]|nr:hypothetical protein [Candidatus Kerfeldbacteria bacterium]
MGLKILFAAISSLVGIACFVPYLRDIFKNKTKPHSYTWLVWTIIQITGVVAMLSAGASIGVASLLIGAILCGYIFILSLRYGTRNITVFDTVCLIGALTAIFIYAFLRNPLLSVIMISLVDLVGFLPTFRKAYLEPESETASNYLLSGISSTFALGALVNFNITTSLYLISVTATNIACAALIWIRGRSNKESIPPHRGGRF